MRGINCVLVDSLLLEAHIVSASFSLLELEHIRAQPKLAQKRVTHVLELSYHLVVFLALLLFDTIWQRLQCLLGG